jgi:uncharacterized integral membrane protein
MVAKKVILLVILVLLLIFIAQNTQSVIVSFLFWEISIPQLLLIPLMVVVGIAIGFLIHWRMSKTGEKQKIMTDVSNKKSI